MSSRRVSIDNLASSYCCLTLCKLVMRQVSRLERHTVASVPCGILTCWEMVREKIYRHVYKYDVRYFDACLDVVFCATNLLGASAFVKCLFSRSNCGRARCSVRFKVGDRTSRKQRELKHSQNYDDLWDNLVSSKFL